MRRIRGIINKRPASGAEMDPTGTTTPLMASRKSLVSKMRGYTQEEKQILLEYLRMALRVAVEERFEAEDDYIEEHGMVAPTVEEFRESKKGRTATERDGRTICYDIPSEAYGNLHLMRPEPKIAALLSRYGAGRYDDEEEGNGEFV